MKGLRGAFYFERNGNGSLAGEFTNTITGNLFGETCEPIGSTTNLIGSYTTQWFDTEQRFAFLSITFKYTDTQNIYLLSWTTNNSIIFIGEGFLLNNTLIGHYSQL